MTDVWVKVIAKTDGKHRAIAYHGGVAICAEERGSHRQAYLHAARKGREILLKRNRE